MREYSAIIAALFFLSLGVSARAGAAASPLAEEDSAQEPPVSSTPSYYSLAEIWAYEWGKPDQPLKGANLFLDGKLLGASPLALKPLLVNKPFFQLSAQMPGYREGMRDSVRIPQEGVVKVAMLPENPDLWFTLPSFFVGLGLVAGGLVAANQENSGSNANSMALIGSGLGVMGLGYTISWAHVPFLEKAVAQANAKNE
jgi:hypothetical protein